jgi:hypothetical protein
VARRDDQAEGRPLPHAGQPIGDRPRDSGCGYDAEQGDVRARCSQPLNESGL